MLNLVQESHTYVIANFILATYAIFYYHNDRTQVHDFKYLPKSQRSKAGLCLTSMTPWFNKQLSHFEDKITQWTTMNKRCAKLRQAYVITKSFQGTTRNKQLGLLAIAAIAMQAKGS